ncbi:hypothetical protein WMY93_032113 [Mugilogobius chulae]|uniref:PDZ domain-containing protein n=1 Tax=Mugilogobius chulae TaxID=88201 RepID=A0AAW0MD76_9GOBI
MPRFHINDDDATCLGSTSTTTTERRLDLDLDLDLDPGQTGLCRAAESGGVSSGFRSVHLQILSLWTEFIVKASGSRLNSAPQTAPEAPETCRERLDSEQKQSAETEASETSAKDLKQETKESKEVNVTKAQSLQKTPGPDSDPTDSAHRTPDSAPTAPDPAPTPPGPALTPPLKPHVTRRFVELVTEFLSGEKTPTKSRVFNKLIKSASASSLSLMIPQHVEEGGPAHAAGLREGDLITHVNGEAVQGLVQHEVVQLILKSGAKVSISATPFENTTIRVGPARKNTHKTKMARRSKKTRSKEGKDDSSRFSSSSSPSSSVPHSPLTAHTPALTHSPAHSPAHTRPTPRDSPGHVRPSSLVGLGHKLQRQFCSPRRKSAGNIALSPLARTPSPTPTPHGYSPLPLHSQTLPHPHRVSTPHETLHTPRSVSYTPHRTSHSTRRLSYSHTAPRVSHFTPNAESPTPHGYSPTSSPLADSPTPTSQRESPCPTETSNSTRTVSHAASPPDSPETSALPQELSRV